MAGFYVVNSSTIGSDFIPILTVYWQNFAPGLTGSLTGQSYWSNSVNPAIETQSVTVGGQVVQKSLLKMFGGTEEIKSGGLSTCNRVSKFDYLQWFALKFRPAEDCRELWSVTLQCSVATMYICGANSQHTNSMSTHLYKNHESQTFDKHKQVQVCTGVAQL